MPKPESLTSQSSKLLEVNLAIAVMMKPLSQSIFCGPTSFKIIPSIAAAFVGMIGFTT